MPSGRKPGDATATLREWTLKLWKEHKRDGALPTSVRFIFYELVTLKVIPKQYVDDEGKKKGRQPHQNVSRALMYWREKKVIPWKDISDETRELRSYTPSDRSIQQEILDTAATYQINPWGPERRAPLILTEDRGVAGALNDLAAEYRCRIAATAGQCGGFLRTDVGPMLYWTGRVLYLGDADKGGADIENHTKEVFAEEFKFFWRHITAWERLAITEEQIKKYKLPIIMKRDARTGKRYPAVECEALRQVVINRIVRQRLDELLPVPLKVVRVQELAQRKRLVRKLHRMLK
jgi:hypothetical protein